MKIALLFFLLFAVAISYFQFTPAAFAQDGAATTCEASTDPNAPRWQTDTILKDPTCAYNSLGTLIGLLLNLALLAGAIIAVFFMIIGAYQWITAGSGDGAKKGRGTIIYAAIGLIGLALVYVFMLLYNNFIP
jgi:hypothetical protein